MRKFNISIIVFLVFIFFANFTKAQNTNQEINFAIFKEKILRKAIIENINTHRKERNLTTLVSNDILIKTSQEQAEFMASKELVTTEGGGITKTTTTDRAIAQGGTRHLKEIVFAANIMKGKIKLTYQNVADETTERWFKKNKNEAILAYPYWNFIGVGAILDEGGKKAYISVTLANYTFLNHGASLIKNMGVPASENQMSLDYFDEKTCRKCDRIKGLSNWHSYLQVKNGAIYFKHPNLKEFKKLIKGERDGLAIDIIQKEQYSCKNTTNLVDFNNVNRGYLLEPMFAPEILENNESMKKRSKLEIKLADFPKEITGDYEINLLIIQDNFVCKNLQRTFLKGDEGILDYKISLPILMDTIPKKLADDYKLVTESKRFTIKLPLNKEKTSYTYDDFKSYINDFNEPDFIINSLDINSYYAFDEELRKNEEFQLERANTILTAFQSSQKDSISATVNVHGTWEQFTQNAVGTMFEPLASMNLKKAQKYVKDNLSDELRAILQDSLNNYRYADIKMNVTFDLTSNESKEKFVMDRFKKTKKYKPEALMMQKYIIRQVLDGNFTEKAITSQKISKRKKYTNFMVNKWCAKVKLNKGLNEKLYEEIAKLYNKYFENHFIAYNYLYSEVTFKKLGDDTQINDIQEKINVLYETTLSKKLIDKLNLKYQLKIMKDEKVGKKIALISFKKAKELILEIEEMSWEQSLFLAYKFIDKKDYVFSAQLLESHLYDEEPSEDLIYTYLSLCSHDSKRQYTDAFVKAMHIAQTLNKKRYCNLLKNEQFSIRIFENTKVKKEYCKSCN